MASRGVSGGSSFTLGQRALKVERLGGSERTLLRDAASLLAADLTLSDLFDRLTRMLADFVDASVVFIALARPDGRHTIEYFFDHGDVLRFPHLELTAKSRARAVITTGKVIWGNSPEVWAPEGAIPIHADKPWTNDTTSAMFVPMTAAGETLGCLSVQTTRADAYVAQDVDAVAAIGHYLAVAVQNQRLYQALQRNADYDPLTGLANHSRIVREIDAGLAETTSTRTMSAIMFNVVNFARFNELYGYGEGDGVLRSISDVLREVEDIDEGITVGRFGGDTFMVVLRPPASDMTASFLARLFSKLREIVYVSGAQTIPVSLACGYVVAPFDAGHRQDVVSLCVHRTRLSRKQGCRPIGEDEIDAYVAHGDYEGIETIVESLLDRDPYTRVHVLQVNHMAKLWSEYNLELDRAELQLLLQASLLHDVGKLLVSDKVLVKPGPLTVVEYCAVQQHAGFGEHILQSHFEYTRVAELVGQHHERWDGNGYPRGLKGEEIHPIARAVAILDVFSAMVADRPYHRGVSESAALEELTRCAGTQFDPELVAKFVDWRQQGRPPQLS